jgi:threonyl-tRNA synthetase
LGQKFVDGPELWKKTEEMVRNVLNESGINYVEVANEAAFYGPKIDVQVWSTIGREFTLATNQVDFAVPRRFGLVYTTSENSKETPLCIHRAPLGTHERFIGFLIEHFAGSFPVWLAPEQVRLVTVTEAQNDYARRLERELKEKDLRVTLDDSREKLGAKIRLAELAKVPYILTLGERESTSEQVSVRSRKLTAPEAKPWPEFFHQLLDEIATRSL